MMNIASKNRRDGFTLVEVLIALMLLGALTAMTLGAYNEQFKTFHSGMLQLDATQNLRYALSVFERDLPTTGSGVPPEQPFIVYADTHVVAVNADYMSNVPNDAFSVYVDTMQPPNAVNALTKPRRITIPGTTAQYPDTSYKSGASNSPAETIIFFVLPDSSGGKTGTFALWRQVNDEPPELMARNLQKSVSGPFFRYRQRVTPLSGSPFLDTIPKAWLPLQHVRPIHNSPSDTLPFARIDRIRAVEIVFGVTDDGPIGKQRLFQTRRTIALPNAGRQQRKTCGDEPLLGPSFSFTATNSVVDGAPVVILAWPASVDESAGERDVVRYAIWKATSASVVTGDPWISIPAGHTNYSYTDSDLNPGDTYHYAVAAQDCTPRLSSHRVVSVTVPPP
jgi:prepilin-type N-terminal cleavage/methylation domain-containing protein